MTITADRDAVMAALATVDDPELPINIIQLGIVKQTEIDAEGRVEVVVNPTFCGCPALPVIEQRIRTAVAAVDGVSGVHVTWDFGPDWDVDAINGGGSAILKSFGIAISRPDTPVHCPYCDSTDVTRESAFGSTLCRSAYHCASCRNPFEVMKQLGSCRATAATPITPRKKTPEPAAR